MNCACGLPARLAADVHRPDCLPERLCLCSVDCPTVRLPGVALDVLLEGDDYRRMIELPGAHPCWCGLRRLGGILPWCPEHGREVP